MDGQTRERDGQKYEQVDRQTDIQTNGETDISIFWIDGQTAREREGQADVQRQTETDRDRQRQTETDRDRQRQTETDRDKDRQTDRSKDESIPL